MAMTFQLSRLYHFKTKAFWSYFSKWLLFIALGSALILLKNGTIGFETIVALLILTIFYEIDYIRRLPGKFTIENREVILWMYLKKRLPDGFTFNRRHYRTAKFFVTVRNVKQIEYSSDVEEKVGTLRIYGEIRTQSKNGEYVDPYEPLEVVELIGVKSFREVRYQLQKEFPEAIFTRIQ